MDISKLSTGAKIVLGASIAFLIVSIFKWQEIDFEGVASVGVNMWHGWGVLAGLLAIAIIVWEGLRLADIKIEFGLSSTMVTAALAALLLITTLLKFLVSNEFRTFWAFLGLLLAIAVAVGAFLNMKAAGESMGEFGSSMKAAAGSAAASAKASTEKRSGHEHDGHAHDGHAHDGHEHAPTAPAAPAVPSTPATPTAPEAPAAPAPAAEGVGDVPHAPAAPAAEGDEPPRSPA